MTKGRSIRLFLVDGTPGGIITAEIMNWTGHVMTAPRSRLPDLVRRPEAGRTGIYILSGTDGGYKPTIYVGETDSVGKRLAQHNKDDAKEFWEQTCIVTSKDQNLTKAHVRYLESRLIQIAAGAGRARLANSTAPDVPMLPEADLSDMEVFIDQLRVVLPVLGLDLLKEQTIRSPNLPPSQPDTPADTLLSQKDTPLLLPIAGGLPPLAAQGLLTAQDADPPAPATCPLFELTSPKHDLSAAALEVDGEFVVLAGSQAQPSWIGVPTNSYRPLHQRLIEEGVLVADNAGGPLRFSRDYAFSKPSAASAVILGRQDNGRVSWRIKGSKTTYAQWQDGQITDPATQGDEE
ncbi:GIY-YIG nuclease family protein [Novispirillum itersonii]|uniref:GIY-YIG domain-containing protein n=1 Tax=Novispirillum itersonii TaxID=189 RepID=A0A7W9ZJM3_NOVIT|nr:GIY-YIG nuclease family protein [Novispirillum itersonii]MBB6211767.1 hypothetical protein [Novispirillum itersonii]